MGPVFYPSLQSERPSQGVLSIRGYMMLLIAAILLPMLTLVAIVAWEYGTAARRTIEAQRLDVANNLRILIDREIDRTAGFLDGLSNAPGLRNNTGEIVERVSKMARDRGFQALVAYDSSGHVIFASPAGSQPVSAESVGFAEVLSDRNVFVSGLIATAGEKPGLYFVSVPMMADGWRVGVLSGGLPSQGLQRLFAEAGLRSGWSAGIVDSTGILLARSKNPEKFVGLPAQLPMYDYARGTSMRGLYQIVDRDGINVKNAYGARRRRRGACRRGPTVVVDAPLWHTRAHHDGDRRRADPGQPGAGVHGRQSSVARAIQRLGIAAVAIASGDVDAHAGQQHRRAARRLALDRGHRRRARRSRRRTCPSRDDAALSIR